MKKTLILLFLVPFFTQNLKAQTFTLQQVIELAFNNSIAAKSAKQQFITSYWEHRAYVASRLPSLELNTSPYLSKGIGSQRDTLGQIHYFQEKTKGYKTNVYLNQRIDLTGAYLSLGTGLNYTNIYTHSLESKSYTSVPYFVSLTQPLSGYNWMKWENKIKPLKYQEAKKNYIIAVETVSAKAVQYFFELSLAQLNIKISTQNFQNNDTLYNIAKGRYNIGTIAKNELLQMEQSYLNAKLELKEAQLNLDIAKFKLKSYLGIQDTSDISLITPDNVPRFQIDIEKALNMAKLNNPEVIAFERRLLEAESTVRSERSKRFEDFKVNLNYGTNQFATEFSDAYKNPLEQQGISFTLNIPIFDWGKSRGDYKMAKSKQEIVELQVQQDKIDFDQDVFLKVARFNMMADQLDIAAKSDTIGRDRYEVTKQRFKIGKIDILNLNQAQTDKDYATRSYISTLYTYWQSYYTIRQTTLYDFENNKEIEYDYKKIVE